MMVLTSVGSVIARDSADGVAHSVVADARSYSDGWLIDLGYFAERPRGSASRSLRSFNVQHWGCNLQ